MFSDREVSSFSLRKAIQSLASGNLHNTLEGELLNEHASRAGTPITPSRFTLPWALLAGRASGVSDDERILARHRSQRGLDAASTGADIIGADQAGALDALRGTSAVIDAGATLVYSKANVDMPELTAPSSAYWLPTEDTPITVAQPEIANLRATPHTVAALTRYSRLLATTSNQIERALEINLRRAIGHAIDSAAIAGTGADGQPLGLLNAADIASVSIGSDLPAAVRAGLKSVESAGARPSAWLVGSDQAETLRETAWLGAGTESILRNGRIDGLPAVVSNANPSALVCGPMEDLTIVVFGGVEVAIDPRDDWTKGICAVRCMAHVDIVPRRAASFVKIS